MNTRILCLLFLLLSGILTAADTPAEARQKDIPPALRDKKDLVVIRSMDDCNKLLEKMALQMQTRSLCYFAGKLKGKEKNTLRQSLWFDYCGKYSYKKNEDDTIYLTLVLKDNARMLAAYKNKSLRKKLDKTEQVALKEAEERLAVLLTPGMTELEIVRALHDDLVKRCSYNTASGGNATTMLLTNRGVCEAYSRTYHLLCSMAGIQVHSLLGHVGRQAHRPHAWNMVRVDGDWYHVDVTWDDPIDRSKLEADTVSHTYFLLTDKQISFDHQWRNPSLPVSAEKDAVYFRRSKKYFSSYRTLWKAVSDAIKRKDATYEAYMAAFVNKGKFLNSFKEAQKEYPNLEAVVGWSGPEGSSGVVSFRFEYSHNKKPMKEEAAVLAEETVESARSWLSEDVLMDYLDGLWDGEEIQQRGQQLLEEGKGLMEEGGKLMDEGVDKLKDLF